MKLFSERLRELRKERGLTLDQLSDATKISRTALSYWENGEREPLLGYIIILVKFFGCTAGYLIGTEEY